jgi:N-acetylneuraminic acid mutarotase
LDLLFPLYNLRHKFSKRHSSLFTQNPKQEGSRQVKISSYAVISLAFVLVRLHPLSAQIQGQWATTGAMQSGRELNAQTRLLNGKVLSIGGVDNNGNLLASAEVYNPIPRTWALTGSMAEARESFPAVLLANGKVLVAGGVGTSNTVLASAELYDPATGAWTPAGLLSVARFGHTATLVAGGKVLVTGGCTADPCTTDTAVSELYDPVANSWSTTGSLTTARSYQTAVLLKTGKVLVVGGSTGAATSSCELYNPATGTWSNAASTTVVRYLNTTTLLADGKVLVTGGTPSRGPLSSAEIYDPTANTWTATGIMTNPRYAHAAALLPDGTVLVTGGIGQSISCGKACTGYIPTAKAEIYSETAGKFTAIPNLSRAEAYHSMTILATGRALVNGGSATTSICCVVINSAEIYTPLSLTFSAASLNFGLLQTGLNSASQTITVTNVSNHPVNFSSIASSGDFAQSHTCPPTLNTGQNCTITVTFSPTAAGARNGAVTLKDNCPGSTVQTIALTGTGETLALGFAPGSLNLGNVMVSFSSTQSATLVNDGSAPVNISGISVIPADGTFTQTNNCPATLKVQQTCTVQVVFTPPDVFTYSATISVANSAGGAAKLAVSGTGLDGP